MRLRVVGGDQDPTNLIHMGAREYDPVLGRFASIDPLMDLADPGSWNGYAYAGNNPIVRSDPSGLWAKDPDLDDQYGRPKASGTGHSYHQSPPGSSGGTASSPKNASAPKRFWNSLTSALGGFANDSIGMVEDNFTCPSDMDACRRQWDRGAKAFWFMNDVAGCLMWLTDYCNSLESNFDCQNGVSAECLGNLTAFAVEVAVTHKLGKLGPVGEADSAAGAMLKGCLNSFSPDTLVLMADGSTKKIADIKVGDAVVATDPESDFTTGETVTQLHNNLDHQFADVTIEDEHGRRQIIHTTAHHRFWDASAKQWVEAGSLQVQDALRAPGDQLAMVVAVKSFSSSRYMRNLTVARLHTYYVLAGETPVLVHNTCPTGGPKNLGRSYGTNATVVANPEIKIQGLRGSQQTGHGINQIIDRGVSPESIVDATRNPIAVIEQRVGGATRYTYLGRDATVVMRQGGQLVTAWPVNMNKPFVQQIIADAQ